MKVKDLRAQLDGLDDELEVYYDVYTGSGDSRMTSEILINSIFISNAKKPIIYSFNNRGRNIKKALIIRTKNVWE